MLVKLGDSWFDPAKIVAIEPCSLMPLKQKGEGLGYEIDPHVFVIYNEKERIIIHGVHKVEADAFATIVNEALVPKQSWSEEVSEPANT